MKVNGVLIGFTAAAVGIFLLFRNKMQNVALTVDQQREYLLDWASKISEEYKTHFLAMLQTMTDDEIKILYVVVKDYFMTGTEIPEGDFKTKATALFMKYQIGT